MSVGAMKGFLILAFEEGAADVEGTKLCLRGSTLDDFMQAHPNLRSSRAIAKMKLRARLHMSNMVKIESLHASLRRLIISRSIQTHGQEFIELCGECL